MHRTPHGIRSRAKITSPHPKTAICNGKYAHNSACLTQLLCAKLHKPIHVWPMSSPPLAAVGHRPTAPPVLPSPRRWIEGHRESFDNYQIDARRHRRSARERISPYETNAATLDRPMPPCIILGPQGFYHPRRTPNDGRTHLQLYITTSNISFAYKIEELLRYGTATWRYRECPRLHGASHADLFDAHFSGSQVCLSF